MYTPTLSSVLSWTKCSLDWKKKIWIDSKLCYKKVRSGNNIIRDEARKWFSSSCTYVLSFTVLQHYCKFTVAFLIHRITSLHIIITLFLHLTKSSTNKVKQTTRERGERLRLRLSPPCISCQPHEGIAE